MISSNLKRFFTVASIPPTIDSFTASGGYLYWETSNATSVSINQGVGDVALDGSYAHPTTSPCDSTLTYTLTASADGLSVSASVTVSRTRTQPWWLC